MSDTSSGAIDSMMTELRMFPPPAEFSQRAHIRSMEQYRQMYQESLDDPQAFWGKMAENLHWFGKWKQVLDWKPPFAKWFVGGKLNACYNCVDLQIERGHGDKAAILWEGEPVGGMPGTGGFLHPINHPPLQNKGFRR